MRHQFPRVSASVATLVALLSAFVLTAPRDGDEGPRHSAVRTTRGSVQRLDANDVIAHGAEESEPDLTPATVGIGDFTAATADAGGPALLAVLAESLTIAADPAGTIVRRPDARTRAFVRSYRPDLSRAPPRS